MWRDTFVTLKCFILQFLNCYRFFSSFFSRQSGVSHRSIYMMGDFFPFNSYALYTMIVCSFPHSVFFFVAKNYAVAKIHLRVESEECTKPTTVYVCSKTFQLFNFDCFKTPIDCTMYTILWIFNG